MELKSTNLKRNLETDG